MKDHFNRKSCVEEHQIFLWASVNMFSLPQDAHLLNDDTIANACFCRLMIIKVSFGASECSGMFRNEIDPRVCLVDKSRLQDRQNFLPLVNAYEYNRC
jgi:hypothetical protein